VPVSLNCNISQYTVFNVFLIKLIQCWCKREKILNNWIKLLKIKHTHTHTHNANTSVLPIWKCHMASPSLTTGQDCPLACEWAHPVSFNRECRVILHISWGLSPSSHTHTYTHTHCYSSLEWNSSDMMLWVRNEPLLWMRKIVRSNVYHQISIFPRGLVGISLKDWKWERERKTNISSIHFSVCLHSYNSDPKNMVIYLPSCHSKPVWFSF